MRFDRLKDRREFRGERDVKCTSLRLAVDCHLLRHTVHLHLGWLPRTGPMDAKVLLGIHVHEDAVFATRMEERLRELEEAEHYFANPDDDLRPIAEALDGLETWAEYIGVVYTVIKPCLIDAWERHYTTTDPLMDEPTARLLAEMMNVTAQHISGGVTLVEALHQLPGDEARRVHAATARIRPLVERLVSSDTGARVSREEQPIMPRIKAPVERVARDSFIQVEETPGDARSGGDGTAGAAERRRLHRLMNEELQLAEVLAESAHANPHLPWPFHEDMARLTWDRMRRVRVLEKLLEAFGGRWGEFPVDVALSSEVLGAVLRERLKLVAAMMEARLGSGGSLTVPTDNGPVPDNIHPAVLEGFSRSDDTYLLRICREWLDAMSGVKPCQGVQLDGTPGHRTLRWRRCFYEAQPRV